MGDTGDLSVSSCEPGKTALIVAHPGHELMVYHWMERNQPLYFCLTDGSGGGSASRLASTGRLLERVGVSAGQVFGRFSDKEVYRFLLDKRVDVFVALAQELAHALAKAGVECVAGDAVEGFNPVHDVCRIVIDGAVAQAQRQRGVELRSYDFVLDSRPDSCPGMARAGAIWLRLDDAALKRKLTAAYEYAEIRDEVHGAMLRFGKQAFALECLRPAVTQFMIDSFEHEAPAYERYGEVRVSEGVYREIIHYRQHVLPVLTAILKGYGDGQGAGRICA